MHRTWKVGSFLLFAAVTLLLGGCAKKPTAEQCAKDKEKVDEWILKNFDKDAEIEKKYPDLAKLLADGNFDKAREPMTNAMRERYKAAGANAACAELAVGEEIARMKCEKEGQKVEEWGQKNPDKDMEIREKYAELENLFQAGDVEKIKDPLTKAFTERFIAAGADVTCVEANVDEMLKMLKCSKEMEKIQKWSSENPEKAKEMEAKYPELEKLMKDEKFDQARGVMVKLMKESLTAATADVSCAETMADYVIQMAKAFSNMNLDESQSQPPQPPEIEQPLPETPEAVEVTPEAAPETVPETPEAVPETPSDSPTPDTAGTR